MRSLELFPDDGVMRRGSAFLHRQEDEEDEEDEDTSPLGPSAFLGQVGQEGG